MGLPFQSGHVLALRRFSASSIGPAYTSVWHRAPTGEWTFYQDVSSELACPRYFGPALARTLQRHVDLDWLSPTQLAVRVDGGRDVELHVSLATSPATRLMSAAAGRVPAPLWRSAALLRSMSYAASHVLGAGRLTLTGRVPAGQRFAVQPRDVFLVSASHATVAGVDLGEMGALDEQSRLGDFWLPQRGLFVVGSASFAAATPGERGGASADRRLSPA